MKIQGFMENSDQLFCECFLVSYSHIEQYISEGLKNQDNYRAIAMRLLNERGVGGGCGSCLNCTDIGNKPGGVGSKGAQKEIQIQALASYLRSYKPTSSQHPSGYKSEEFYGDDEAEYYEFDE